MTDYDPTNRHRRVHVLTSHLDPDSLTVALARRIENSLRGAGAVVSFENTADVRGTVAYEPADIRFYRDFLAGQPHTLAPDISAEHALLEACDALVIVFPVYWWSFPADLKVWVDRVFTGGWTWGMQRAGRDRSALAGLDAHVVPLAGLTEEAYDRHGYRTAIETLVQHGIVEYNGLRSGTWTWMWDAANHPERTLNAADEIVRGVLDN